MAALPYRLHREKAITSKKMAAAAVVAVAVAKTEGCRCPSLEPRLA